MRGCERTIRKIGRRVSYVWACMPAERLLGARTLPESPGCYLRVADRSVAAPDRVNTAQMRKCAARLSRVRVVLRSKPPRSLTFLRSAIVFGMTLHSVTAAEGLRDPRASPAGARAEPVMCDRTIRGLRIQVEENRGRVLGPGPLPLRGTGARACAPADENSPRTPLHASAAAQAVAHLQPQSHLLPARSPRRRQHGSADCGSAAAR